jgi:cytoplasmic iron level regulating protein YaaA (DUF328/UPF0246 family)
MTKNLYDNAAELLSRCSELTNVEVAKLLNCSESSAANLRSWHKTCDGNADEMREKANEASRRSKRGLRRAA